MLRGGTSLQARRSRPVSYHQWAYLNGVELDFSRPGKPTDNAYIEAFNSRLRAECLNASWFLSMADARNRIEC
jgi:putative transposase